MKLSMTGQEKSYNVIHVTVRAGLTVYIYNRYSKRPSKKLKSYTKSSDVLNKLNCLTFSNLILIVYQLIDYFRNKNGLIIGTMHKGLCNINIYANIQVTWMFLVTDGIIENFL